MYNYASSVFTEDAILCIIRDVKEGTQIGRHLTFVVLCLGARLARRLNLPLKDFQELAGAAYLSELQQASFTQQEAADHMSTSVRKVASMAATLRETFYQVETQAGLPRRIEHLLWAVPASRSRIAQILPEHNVGHLNRAIDKLIGEGRVCEDTDARTPLLSVTRGEARLVGDDWISRLDGVENFMRNVGNTLAHRFWGDPSVSMARTVSLGIRHQDLFKLKRLYEKVLWPELVALEKASIDADNVVDIDLSIFWAQSTDELEEKENE